MWDEAVFRLCSREMDGTPGITSMFVHAGLSRLPISQNGVGGLRYIVRTIVSEFSSTFQTIFYFSYRHFFNQIALSHTQHQ